MLKTIQLTILSSLLVVILSACGEDEPKNQWKTTESGIKFKILKEGKGKSPTEKDQVRCHYKGWLENGEQFDSSYGRGQPATFGVSGVIKGWTEMLLEMKPGEKRQVKIPSKLGYGERGSPPKIPANAPLNFEIELLEVISKK